MTRKDREAQKQYMREWRARQPKSVHRKHAKRVTQRQRELREWYKQLKASLKCKYCPENDSCCLEFHHRDPEKKGFLLSHAVKRGHSRERILAEAAKCDCMCANCHRKLHAGRLAQPG